MVLVDILRDAPFHPKYPHKTENPNSSTLIRRDARGGISVVIGTNGVRRISVELNKYVFDESSITYTQGRYNTRVNMEITKQRDYNSNIVLFVMYDSVLDKNNTFELDLSSEEQVFQYSTVYDLDIQYLTRIRDIYDHIRSELHYESISILIEGKNTLDMKL